MNTANKTARVVLADDHPAILAQAAGLLAGEFEVVGTVSNWMDLITAAIRLDPDVVVLDISMPGLDGIEIAQWLKRAWFRAKIVFLTVHEDRDYVRAALQAGGAAYVLKARLASDLVTAIHEALEGHRFVSPTISLEENS